MEAVIPDLDEVARSYDRFRAVAGVGAIRSESDYDRAVRLIEAILDETRWSNASTLVPTHSLSVAARSNSATRQMKAYIRELQAPE